MFLPIFNVPIFTGVNLADADTDTDICRSLEGNMSVVLWRLRLNYIAVILSYHGLRWQLPLASCIIYCNHKNHTKSCL